MPCPSYCLSVCHINSTSKKTQKNDSSSKHPTQELSKIKVSTKQPIRCHAWLKTVNTLTLLSFSSFSFNAKHLTLNKIKVLNKYKNNVIPGGLIKNVRL